VVESDGVEEALLKVADSYVQLLTPTRPDSPVATFLERRGEGLHHVGYPVDDCAAAREAVKAQGGRVIDEQPRPGSRGTTVAFIHPTTAFGTLIELVQEQSHGPAARPGPAPPGRPPGALGRGRARGSRRREPSRPPHRRAA